MPAGTAASVAAACGAVITAASSPPHAASQRTPIATNNVDVAKAGAVLPNGMWDPKSAQPLLEHYLGKPLDQIDVEYQAYMRQVVAEQYKPSWSD